jgi:hypothetical protein
MNIASTGAALLLLALYVAPAAFADILSPKQILEALPGRWVMEEQSESGKKPEIRCDSENVVVIRIESGPTSLTYISKHETKDAVEYRSLVKTQSANDDVNAPGAIVLQYEGETRLDDKGQPVVWHLLMTDRDTFYWHRQDWPNGNVTRPSHRCSNPNLVG